MKKLRNEEITRVNGFASSIMKTQCHVCLRNVSHKTEEVQIVLECYSLQRKQGSFTGWVSKGRQSQTATFKSQQPKTTPVNLGVVMENEACCHVDISVSYIVGNYM